MMKNVQLSELSKVNKDLITVIIEMIIDRGNFVDFYDIKKSDLEEIFFRPFYLDDDKLFFFNVMSAICLKDEEFDEENGNVVLDFETDYYEIHEIVNFLDSEKVNFDRLQIMLLKAEKENISVFSIFYEWFRSSVYYKNGEDYSNTDSLRDVWEDIMKSYIE